MPEDTTPATPPAPPPEPDPARRIVDQNAELLDRYMYDLLASKKPLSAAELQAIRGRLKDLNINSVPVKGSAAGDLAEEAHRRGLHYDGKAVTIRPLPPLNTEDDDAASAG